MRSKECNYVLRNFTYNCNNIMLNKKLLLLYYYVNIYFTESSKIKIFEQSEISVSYGLENVTDVGNCNYCYFMCIQISIVLPNVFF